MKLLLVLLLAANAGFYAFAAGYFDHARAADAARPGQQVNADALKILAVHEEGSASAEIVSAAAPVRPALAASTVPASTAPASGEKICLAWRLAPKEADRLVQLFSTQFSEFGLERQKFSAGGGWWIFIPLPLEKAEVQRKRDELNRHGIRDHFVIEGKDRFVISLGVYALEKAAKNFLASLKEKGIEGARVEQRPGKEEVVRIDARGPAAMQGQVIGAVGRLIPDTKPQACQ